MNGRTETSPMIIPVSRKHRKIKMQTTAPKLEGMLKVNHNNEV